MKAKKSHQIRFWDIWEIQDMPSVFTYIWKYGRADFTSIVSVVIGVVMSVSLSDSIKMDLEEQKVL